MDPFDVSRNSNPTSYDSAAKVTKRKRLAKACDACHKSKRRCDGTALCSNCFYASKPCTYTDSNGRSVPAPRQDLNELGAVQDRSRKKSRSEGEPSRTSSLPRFLPSTPIHDHPPRTELEPAMTRELTNLFFSYQHLGAAIIHRPTFTSSLTHPSAVPPFLLLAIYALAAPFSKQLALRTSPPRLAGCRFAEEARALIYNSDGHPVIEPSLQNAQATCLLLLWEIFQADCECPTMQHASSYRELTLRLLKSLDVHTPEHPLLTPVPSKAYIDDSIQKECIRRIFWTVYFLDCYRCIYMNELAFDGPSDVHPTTLPRPSSQPSSTIKPTGTDLNDGSLHPSYSNSSSMQHPRLSWVPGRDEASSAMTLSGGVLSFTEAELRLRLPVDETSFELAMVHSTLPEYLYLPAIRTQYASEYGHTIRVLTIYQRVESAINAYLSGRPDDTSLIIQAFAECSRLLEGWFLSLPAHLQFSQENVAIQQSMLGTPSNTGAWCYAILHVFHASCTLALATANTLILKAGKKDEANIGFVSSSFMQPSGPEQAQRMHGAIEKLKTIMTMLKEKMKCGLMFRSVLWSLVRYCDCNDDPHMRLFASEYELDSGVNLLKTLENRRIPDGLLNARPTESSTHNRQSSSGLEKLTSPSDFFPIPASQLNPTVSTPQTSEQIPGTNPTLPSLKASGLLDWNNSEQFASQRLPSIDFLAESWQGDGVQRPQRPYSLTQSMVGSRER